MSAFERLLVPGCTELPACRCGKEMQIASLDKLREEATRMSGSIIALPATTRGGLPFGLPTQWLKGSLSWRPHARLVTDHEMGRRSTSRLFLVNERVAGPVLHASNAI